MTLFDRLFKPKWQSADPQTRKQGLQELTSSDPILAQLARSDADPGLRRAALARLSDLALIQKVAENDPEAGVREYAQARFRNLLCGKDEQSPALEHRLSVLAQGLPTELAEFLTQHAAEPQLRLAALQQTQNAHLHSDLAINDPALDVRLQALEKIQDLALLQRVAKHTRNRDKRISRKAQERADALSAEQQRAERIEQLSQEMEQLVWDGETGPNVARFAKLEQEWQTLAAQASAATQQRYAHRARALQCSHGKPAWPTAVPGKACASGLEQLLDSGPLAAVSLDDKALAAITQDWQMLDAPQPHDVESQRLARQFEQLQQNIRQHMQDQRQNQKATQQRQAVLQAAQQLLDKPGQITAADIRAVQQRWQRLPVAQPTLEHLHTEFNTLNDKLEARLQRQVQQKDQELAEIQNLIEQLQTALDTGELQQAMNFDQQARARLDQNISLSRAQMADFRHQLRDCAAAIDKLRSWRRWGTNQAREHLCEQVEALIGDASDPTELAKQIRAARAQWKALGNDEKNVPRALWKRFNNACEQAYEPCKRYFEAQAQERQHNRQQRIALCEELERLNNDTDWDGQLDWRAMSRLERDFSNRWRQLGPVNRADKKTLDQRYHEARSRLSARLKPALERDFNRRKGLIKRVENLLENHDLQTAIDGVKKAQAEWQPQILGSQRQEQAFMETISRSL